MVAGGISEQTRQALCNLQAVLEAAGASLERIMKVTVFLQDMADFQAMNAVYSEFINEDPPARSTIQVAALPMGALVEIEATALCRD
jgi:2-iminobutanoate/2-iminopropanoate deaminase